MFQTFKNSLKKNWAGWLVHGMGWLSILPALVGMIQLFAFGQTPLNVEGSTAQRQLPAFIQQNPQFAQMLEREGGRQRDPVQGLIGSSGESAEALILLGLAVTPMSIVFGWRALNKYSREIGLYAFNAMLLHIAIYLADKGFQLSSLVENLHLILATIASAVMLVLAVTSNKWSMKAMGKNWKLLHRSVYAVGILMELHVMFINLPQINPRGVLLTLVVAALLMVRIPAVKRYFIQRRTRTVPASLPA